MIEKTVSHYEIVGKLGEGGMGVVYKAKDNLLGRFVALKFLPPHMTADEEGQARFIQEAKAASALDHPNICTIHEIATSEDGQLFIAMAYYDGETLRTRIQNGALPSSEAIDLACQIAQGLARSHESGIVHRDIKPANIIVTQHGEAKILDFGLAKFQGGTRLTRTATTLGTAAYMSPEQIQGLEIDHRSDIFSWGVIFYEMLSGQLPFSGEYEHALMYAILHEPAKPLAELRTEIPAAIQEVLSVVLAKAPADRYQDTSALVTDLQAIKQQLRSGESNGATVAAGLYARSGMKAGRAKKAPNKKPALIWSAAGLAAAIAIFSIALFKSGFWDGWFGGNVSSVKHIAVLPFANIGEEPENKALCDGLVETLTSKLTQLEQFQGQFWVVPSSEIRRSEVRTAREALQLFGANVVVSGSLQRMTELLRLTINLIDARTLRQLASQMIDDPMQNSTVLQDEAVIRLAGMLNVELQPETQRILQAGGTTVPGAYEFYLQGRGYLQDYNSLPNVEAGITLFDRALQADPEYALAFAGKGEAYLRKFQLTKETQWVKLAEDNCERAIKIDDLTAPVYVTRGMLYNETGRYQEALTAFQKALELDAHNATAYRGRATAFLSLGKSKEAEAIYKQAIALKPDYWGGYNDLGVFYFRQGRYGDAIPQFEHVIDLTPQNARGYSNLGAMYQQLDDKTRAIEYYGKALEISPVYETSSNLATLYFYKHDYVNAAKMYEQALELESGDYKVWGYLASAYKRIPGKQAEAKSAYSEAIKRAERRLAVNPAELALVSSLAGYYMEFGENEKARAFLDRAVRLQPRDVKEIYDIGFIFEQLGERARAVEWIGKALAQGYPLDDIKSNPALADLRKDPKFKQMLNAQ